ncbi:hypothetical protein GGS24DRAFT_496207 [Hypoxylon argillaceum]|nr:hypothetical protein GGS24DRAFT_496207 [Hypoxylon argillaceum]
MPREAAAPAPLERMPVELRVSIMGHITNFKSLRNLVVSSRVYKETLRSNESSVAMAIIINLVGQDNYKLAIMAEVSSHITVADKTAVEGFIDNYTRPEEWPLSVYSMRLAVAVRRLNKTMYKAMSTIRCDDLNIWHLGSQSLSWTERTRLHRVLYLCEIAGNLFRWNNHTMPAMHIPPPFPDLCRRFWRQVPAWDATRLQIMVSSPNFHENVTAALQPHAFSPSPAMCRVLLGQCPRCSQVVNGDHRNMLAGAYLGAGTETWAGQDLLRIWRLIFAVNERYSESCNGNNHEFDPTMGRRVFHYIGHATNKQPLPPTSPFYERNPGIQVPFYEMACPFTLLPSLKEFGDLCGLSRPFIHVNSWFLAVADSSRLPRTPSSADLERKRQLWSQQE